MHSRLLLFHSHIWREYWRRMLLHLQQEGRSTMVISDWAEAHHYRHVRAAGGRQTFLPDLRKPMPFEDSAEQVQRIETLIESCERATGKSARRILLSAERDMGAAYSKGFFYWPSNQLRAYCLKSGDNAHKALLRAFAFTQECFESFEPDAVIGRGISEPFNLVAWFLARRHGIPTLSARFSKLAGKKAFWTADYAMYNTEADRRYSAMVEQGRRPSEAALEKLANFRARPEVVDYIAGNWKRGASFGFTSRLASVCDDLKVRIRHLRKGFGGRPPQPFLPKALELLRISLNAPLQSRSFRTYDPEQLSQMRYAYFPNHKEPELMLNFEAPACHDQRHLVKHIASMIPAGMRLLVKEHRFNIGRRPAGYYDYLSRLPGVRIVHPLDDQFKYIKHAQLVVTDNGSTGWEGLQLRRPVVTLERTLYDAPALHHPCYAFHDLDKVILKALEAPCDLEPDEYDRRLALRIDAEYETTFDTALLTSDIEQTVALMDAQLDRAKP